MIKNRMDNAGAGNPQVFYNVVPTPPNVREGEIFVTLDKWEGKRVPALLNRLQHKFRDDPEAQITVVVFDNGPPIDAPVAVRLRCPDLQELRRLAAEVAATLRQVPGLRDASNPVAGELLDLTLVINGDKAALFGVSEGDARQALRLAVEGQNAGLLIDDDGDSWPVTVRLAAGAGPDMDVLENIYVSSSAGGSVPQLQIADPQLRSEPAQINRRAFERAVTVTARVQPDQNVAAATEVALVRLNTTDLPPG